MQEILIVETNDLAQHSFFFFLNKDVWTKRRELIS